MLKTDCFDHHCPGEPQLGGRIEASAYANCNCAWSVGENLAWGSGKKGSPASITRAWMKSPSHRANMLKRPFEHLGVAVDSGRPGHSGAGNALTYTIVFGFRD